MYLTEPSETYIVLDLSLAVEIKAHRLVTQFESPTYRLKNGYNDITLD